MTKEEFVHMINLAEKFSEEVDRWCDFGINVLESPIGNIPWEIFNAWAGEHFDDNGQDWIDWYLFERISIKTGEILACFDENGKGFYIKTPEDLWEIIIEYLK